MKPTIPINYDLEFEPNFKNFTFRGNEYLTINSFGNTNTIILNSAELKIKNCTVETANKTLKAKVKLDVKKEELQIKLSQKIKGKAIINFNYTGILNDRLLGFYRSQYKDKGKTKYLATTQFEAADARRAFVCWDQPEAKATFNITIIADSHYTAISNMPVKSKRKSGKKTIYKFGQTPVMSTYLVYLGVGEFEFLKGKIGKVEVRVISTRGHKAKGKYALDLGKKLLRAYENYFGIKYPFPKLDLIAIPDFAAGAMENWGAITFRETILHYDPKTSSTQTKQRIAEVISHEIAHQWFGNLVTMKWWNDLWLNESFATFMATKFVDKFYPEWDSWEQFIEDAMNVSMGLDAMKTSHPIDVTVKSPSEIREIFDAISYDKGGCVLRMLENYVGEKNFRKGLKHYLKKHMYKNAVGDDLWNAIGSASRLPVRKVVHSWIKQVGFPLVSVEKQNSELLLKQERFLMLPTTKSQKGIWEIPISIGLKKESAKKLMTKKSDKIKSKDSCVVNFGRHGFYRVKYDEDTLFDLKTSIVSKEISHIDRWAIQNDLFALCVSGNEHVKNYLDFSDAYNEEENYLPSMNVANNLNFLYFLTFFEDFNHEIREYGLNYLRKILERLTWKPKKGEKSTDSLLRSYSIAALGKMDDEDVIAEAEKKFQQFLKNPNSIPTDLLEPIFIVIAWHGDAQTHKKLIALYRKAKTQEEKIRFLTGLCYFKDEKLLLKTLKFSQSNEVRSQNMHIPIMRVAGNPYGKKILWPWLKQNWKKLSKKVGHGNPLLNRVVSTVSLISDDTMTSEVKNFFKKNPTPGTKNTLSQALERAQIHSKFLKRIRSEYNFQI